MNLYKQLGPENLTYDVFIMVLQETEFWCFVFIIVRPRNVAIAVSYIQGVSFFSLRNAGRLTALFSFLTALQSATSVEACSFGARVIGRLLCAVVGLILNYLCQSFFFFV